MGIVTPQDWQLASRTLDASLAAREADVSGDPFELEPLPLDAWLADSHYSNHGFDLGPAQYRALQHIEWVYDPATWTALGWDDPTVRLVHLICLKWGKGSGKDTIAQLGLTRIAYLLSCLRSPQAYLGISSFSTITMLNVAVSAPQANSVFFDPLSEMIKANIKARGFWYGRADVTGSKIDFEKRLDLRSGHSQTSSQEGANLIAGVADEIAEFFTEQELEKRSRTATGRKAQMSAEAIDTMLRTSGRSRFPAVFKAIYLSWTRFKGDYIERLYTEGEAELASLGEESEWYISHKATWEANPTKKRSDFDADYRKKPEDSKAKYECLPPDSRDRFFRNLVSLGLAFPERIWEWPDGDITSGPVRFEYRWGPDPDAPALTGWQAVYEFHEDFKPIDWSPCHVHIDLAWTGDQAGIGLSHVAEYVRGETEDEEGAQPIATEVVELDLALQLPQGSHGEIELRWARQLVFRLVEAGWWIAGVTLDGYQSVDTIQTLNAALGVPDQVKGASAERKKVAETYSLDRTTEGYDTLKSLVYGRLFRGYRLPKTLNGERIDPEDEEVEDPNAIECIWWKEMKALERTGGLSTHAKVDHPPYGSKDVADGIAGSARGALKAARVWGVGSPDDTEELWTGGASEFDHLGALGSGTPSLGGQSSYMGLD